MTNPQTLFLAAWLALYPLIPLYLIKAEFFVPAILELGRARAGVIFSVPPSLSRTICFR
jgi:hypothetical protein